MFKELIKWILGNGRMYVPCFPRGHKGNMDNSAIYYCCRLAETVCKFIMRSVRFAIKLKIYMYRRSRSTLSLCTEKPPQTRHYITCAFRQTRLEGVALLPHVVTRGGRAHSLRRGGACLVRTWSQGVVLQHALSIGGCGPSDTSSPARNNKKKTTEKTLLPDCSDKTHTQLIFSNITEEVL